MSLATGYPPLFFQNAASESLAPLPTIGTEVSTSENLPISSSDLLEIWHTLRGFCNLINDAHTTGVRISEQRLLDSMTSIMYRLLNLGCMPSQTDEAFRLAMLTFSARPFLQWRKLQIPLIWLVSQYMCSVLQLIQSNTRFIDARALYWLSMILRLALPSVDLERPKALDAWLVNIVRSHQLVSWDQSKDILSSYLWIDITCDLGGRDLFAELSSRCVRADHEIHVKARNTILSDLVAI